MSASDRPCLRVTSLPIPAPSKPWIFWAGSRGTEEEAREENGSASLENGQSVPSSRSDLSSGWERVRNEETRKDTDQVLIPFGVASSDVWGLKTLIPLADSRSREACRGSDMVTDLIDVISLS